MKTAKLYFYDSGLLSYLLGIRSSEELVENRLKGNLFENMIVAEFQKQNYHMYLHREYYFWQDSNSHEVDILLKTNSGFDIYEIKATETIKPSLFEKMNYFEELAKPAKVNKTLIYGGNKDQKRSNYKISSWMP